MAIVVLEEVRRASAIGWGRGVSCESGGGWAIDGSEKRDLASSVGDQEERIKFVRIGR